MSSIPEDPSPIEINSVSSSFEKWADQIQGELVAPEEDERRSVTRHIAAFQTEALPQDTGLHNSQSSSIEEPTAAGSRTVEHLEEGHESASASANLEIISSYLEEDEVNEEDSLMYADEILHHQRGNLIQEEQRQAPLNGNGSDEDDDNDDEQRRLTQGFLRDREHLLKIGLLQPSWGYPPLDEDGESIDMMKRTTEYEPRARYRLKYPQKGSSFSTLPVINFNEYELNPISSKKYNQKQNQLIIFQNGKSYLYSKKKDCIIGEFDFRGQLFHRLYLWDMDSQILKLVHEDRWREVKKR